MELRQALAREIEYRRQLEGEVAGLKDSVQSLLQWQRYTQMSQAAAAASESSEDGRTPASRSASRARPPSASPRSERRPSPADVSLSPVLPVSSKVAELEDNIAKQQLE